MVTVAQMVRAPDCGSGSQGFESLLSHGARTGAWCNGSIAVSKTADGSSNLSVSANNGSMAEWSKAAPC